MNTYIVALHGGTRFIINAHGYYQATNGGRDEYVFVLHGPGNKRTVRSFDVAKVAHIERRQEPVHAA